MKKCFYIFLLCFIFFGCNSAKLVSTTKIPKDKVTIYLNFDNTQSTVETTGFVSGNTFYASTDTASFNTLKNFFRQAPNHLICNNHIIQKINLIFPKIRLYGNIIIQSCY